MPLRISPTHTKPQNRAPGPRAMEEFPVSAPQPAPFGALTEVLGNLRGFQAVRSAFLCNDQRVHHFLKSHLKECAASGAPQTYQNGVRFFEMLCSSVWSGCKGPNLQGLTSDRVGWQKKVDTCLLLRHSGNNPLCTRFRPKRGETWPDQRA